MRGLNSIIIGMLFSSCLVVGASEVKKVYAPSGELIAYDRDSNGDGKIDLKYKKINPGPDGQELFDYDRDGDGIFEERREREYFQGRLSREVASLGRSGPHNRPNERHTSTFLHSKNKISVSIEKDADRDGNFESSHLLLKDDLPSH
ncbi:MAG: hypothetical protein HYV97_06700 [Bdellovibrio sp.]|nr:hypothetical protein [Bdellovibrio sp.]